MESHIIHIIWELFIGEIMTFNFITERNRQFAQTAAPEDGRGSAVGFM